jgi:hypothetical protein
MTLWVPIAIPPLTFLTVLVAAYALVPLACETQQHLSLHVLALAGVGVAGVGIALAWRGWRAAGLQNPGDEATQVVQARFIAVLGLTLSSLVALVILTFWIVLWIIPPCVR